MATSIRIWKEIFTKKYKESGFNYFGYFDDKYEVLFKKKLSDDLETVWYTGYIKLEEPLKEKYEFESYRNKNIIGCDTANYISKSYPEQLNILRDHIIRTINEYYEYYGY